MSARSDRPEPAGLRRRLHAAPSGRPGRPSCAARAAAAALAAAVLAGCAGPTPRTDAAVAAPPLPAQYPGGAAGGATLLQPDWWRLFGSDELTALVERALAANADVAQAVARVEQAAALVDEAAGARWPTLNAGASAGRSRGPGAGGDAARVATRSAFAASLSTAFEIDLWGRLAQADRAARAQLLAGEAARDTLRLTVAGAVAQAWFGLRSADEQAAATRATLASREQSVRLTAARLSAGTVSRLELEQAEQLRADSALLLRELQRQRAALQSQLAVLTADAALALPEAPLPSTALPVPPAGLPSALLTRRPDLQRARAQLDAADAQLGVARAAAFPTLSLTGLVGGQSAELADLLGAPARVWSLGLGLAGPLFDGGRTAARTDQAAARQREALAAWQGAVLAAFKDTADALADLDAARGAAVDLAARQAAAERALQLAQARFAAGYSGSLELLDAQRSATAAQLDALRNRQAQAVASVALVKALGGGWVGSAPR